MKYFLGLDIGGTKTLIRLEDENKKCIIQKKYVSEKEFYKCEKNIREFIKDSQVSDREIVAMCCGVPGSVSNDGKSISLIPSLGWQGFQIRDELFNKFDFPCFAINDVNCAMWAIREEIPEKNAVFISIGTGVGGAIMLNRNIINGNSGMAGEVGYNLNEEEAKYIINEKVQSEKFGALENKISGTALEKKANSLGLNNSIEMFDKYDDDYKCRLAVDKFIVSLSVVLANIASLLDPEVIILGGGVSNSLYPFINRILKLVSELTPSKVKLRITKLQNNAGAIGACIAARDYFIKELNNA